MELTPKVELLIDNLRKTGNGTTLEAPICPSYRELSHDESSMLTCINNLANKIEEAEKRKER